MCVVNLTASKFQLEILFISNHDADHRQVTVLYALFGAFALAGLLAGLLFTRSVTHNVLIN